MVEQERRVPNILITLRFQAEESHPMMLKVLVAP